MAYNKVIYNNNTLLDVSQTTATDEFVNEGLTYVDKDGSHRTGTQHKLTNSDLAINIDRASTVNKIPVNGYIYNRQGHGDVFIKAQLPTNAVLNLTADNIKYGTAIGFVDNNNQEIVGTYTGACPYLQATAEATDVYHGKTFIENVDGTLDVGTLGDIANVQQNQVRQSATYLDCSGANPVYRNGSMTEHSEQDIGLTQVSGQAIDSAYYDNCTVSLSSSNQALMVPGNIRSGVTILGVQGEYIGNLQSGKTAYADTIRARAIYPDEGFTGLAYLTINPIPTQTVENEYGTTFIWG